MKIERIRRGLEVLNKVNGKMYKFLPDGTDVIEGKSGTAHEFCGSGFVENGDTVVVNEGNALAFRALNDPEPYDKPDGFAVENGILMKNGEPACEQGQMMVKRIIGLFPGSLLLIAEQDGKRGLFSYMPHRDKFQFLANLENENAEVVATPGGKVVIVDNKTEKKIVEDEDGKHTAEAFVHAEMNVYDGCQIKTIEFTAPIVASGLKFMEQDDMVIFVPQDESVTEDGLIERRGCRLWTAMDSDAHRIWEIQMDGDVAFTKSQFYGTFVAMNGNEIWIQEFGSIFSPEIQKLDKANILVDITKESHEYRFTFSDENYNLKTLVSKATRDRGYIVTVE